MAMQEIGVLCDSLLPKVINQLLKFLDQMPKPPDKQQNWYKNCEAVDGVSPNICQLRPPGDSSPIKVVGPPIKLAKSHVTIGEPTDVSPLKVELAGEDGISCHESRSEETSAAGDAGMLENGAPAPGPALRSRSGGSASVTSLLCATQEHRFMRRVIPALFSWEMPLHILQFLKVIGTDDPHLRDTIPEFLDLAPCKGLESSTFKFLCLSLQILDNEELVQSLGLIPAKALYRDKALFYVRLRFINSHGRARDKDDVRDYEEALKTANDDYFQLLVNIYALVYHALTTDLSNGVKADSASCRTKVVKHLQGIARPRPRRNRQEGVSPGDGKGNMNPKKTEGTIATNETQEGDSKKAEEASKSSKTQEAEGYSQSGSPSKEAAARKKNTSSGSKQPECAVDSEDRGAEAAKKPKVEDKARNKNDGQIMLDVTRQSKDKMSNAAKLELPLGTFNSFQMPSAKDMSNQWHFLMKRTWNNAQEAWFEGSVSAKSGSESECTPLLNEGCGGVWPGADENPMVASRVKAAMSFFSCKTCCMMYLAATSGKYHENKQRAVEVTMQSMSSCNLKEPEAIACVSDFLTFVGTCHPSFDSFILGLHFARDVTLPCGQRVGMPGHLSPVISSPLNVVRNASSVKFWRHVSGSEHPAYESLQLRYLCLQNYGKHETVLADRPCGLPLSVMSFIPIDHRDEVLQDLYQVTKATMVEPFHQSLYKLYLEHFKRCSEELGKAHYPSSPLLMAMTQEVLDKFKQVEWSAIWDKKEGHDWPKEDSSDFMDKCMECFEHLAKSTPAKENDVPAAGTVPATPRTSAKSPGGAGKTQSGSLSQTGQQRAAPKPTSSKGVPKDNTLETPSAPSSAKRQPTSGSPSMRNSAFETPSVPKGPKKRARSSGSSSSRKKHSSQSKNKRKHKPHIVDDFARPNFPS